jgi:hypothetical protein
VERILPDKVRTVRQNTLERKRLLHALLCGAFACAVILATGLKAKAGDDEEVELESFEEKILKSILGGDKPMIDYRERSPLVVPPNATALPKPESASIAADPAWPKDADIQRAKKRRKDPREMDSRDRNTVGRALRPDELNVGRGTASASGGPGSPVSSREQARRESGALTPGELGYKGGLFDSVFSSKEKEETARFTGEAPRVSLTDPPAGYMTPSPNFPYGLTPKNEAAKPLTFEERAVR